MDSTLILFEEVMLSMFDRLTLRKSYLLLILFTVFFSGLSLGVTLDKAEWLGAYLSNIASGIIGSLIVILLIDRIIESNREKERHRVVKIALRRLSPYISRHMHLLCEIFKASTQNKPVSLPSTFKDLFTDDYYKEISFFDFEKEAPVVPKRNWFTYLYVEIDLFKEKIEQIVDAYAIFLDSSLIDMLEKTVNSHFITLLPQLKILPGVDRNHNYKRVYTLFSGMEPIVKEHVLLMLELIEYLNSNSDSIIQLNQEIWRDDV